MLIDPLGDLPRSLTGGVIAIGNFDGVHRGHCRLLARLRSRARLLGRPAVAVSFEPHPLAILRPGSAPPSLMSPARKAEILLQSGADGAAILRTSPEFLSLSAEEFFDKIVIKQFLAVGLVEGSNFGYGRSRTGTIDTLSKQCRSAGLTLDVVEIVTGEGAGEISSSRVRRELMNGCVDVACQVLGRPHRATGVVVAGDRRGRQIGFPTANLDHVPELLPADGVYAARAHVDGKTLAAACNIGANPTFAVDARKVEAHLIGFDGDLYGKPMCLDFLKKLRDVKPFADVAALKAQLACDVEAAERCARDWQPVYGVELGQTIAQWLVDEVGGSLVPLGWKLTNARLEVDGRLIVRWSGCGSLGPAELMGLVGGLEDRIVRVFPEVKSMHWESG